MNPIADGFEACDAVDQPCRSLYRQGIAKVLCLVALLSLGPRTFGQILPQGPTVGYTGGITVADPDNNARLVPGVFTWKSEVKLTGSGWAPFEDLYIYLFGPLNTPGIEPTYRLMRDPDVGLAQFLTDGAGKLGGAFNDRFHIPYENNFIFTFPNDPDITPPGLYRIYATRLNPLTIRDVAYSETFALCPDTIVAGYNGFFGPDWGRMRGGRDGPMIHIKDLPGVPDGIEKYSPERTDPEWMSVWSTRPVSLYATVAETDLDGAKQAAHMAYHDYPWSHFGHDLNLLLVPDPEYRWLLASANYRGEADEAETGRIEWEWEAQNDGTPFHGSYGKGNIGVPLFAMATVGDRVFTVGSWVLDNGHPDLGDRSEIHPARMIATIRKRHTAVPFPFSGPGCVTRASQVDIYVSGHGGGINMYYDQLERMLDNNGKGGARIPDFMPDILFNNFPPVGETYEQFGPKPVVHSLDLLLDLLGVVGIDLNLEDKAGPSAISDFFGVPSLSGVPWTKGPEFRPVNDMDYEFDVPLPPPPPGATQPRVQVAQYSMHTTAVNEFITYTRPDAQTGLPTTAHIRLPYRDADNGIFARTLYFHWDKYSPPGGHWVVEINDILTTRAKIKDDEYVGPQPLYLLADVCGQWTWLTDLNPQGLLFPTIGHIPGFDRVAFLDIPELNMHAAKFDVYLDPSDTMRVFIGGYAQRDMDSLFAQQFARNAYDAGIEVVKAARLGNGDNQDLGGALFQLPLATATQVEALPGQHTIQDTRLPDTDPDDLPGESGPVNTIRGGDARCPNPVLTANFTVTFVPPPQIYTPDSELSFGDVCSGSAQNRIIRFYNGGQGPLVIGGISVSGGGFSLVSPRNFPVTVPAGETSGFFDVTVRFAPTAVGQGSGSLALASNDPCNPALAVPLSARPISGTIKVAANTLRTPSLVVGTTTTWPVTIANSGPCTLFVTPSISGNGYSIVLPASYYGPSGVLINNIIVPPGSINTDLSVKFTAPAVAAKFLGTLSLTSTDLSLPTTKLFFGAEGVPVGMRVLVVGPDGTPYPVVDSIIFQTVGKPPIDTPLLKDVPLTTINPPESWKTIQYHYMTALEPTDAGSAYQLRAQVGNQKQTLSFTLGPDEFKELTITLPQR